LIGKTLAMFSLKEFKRLFSLILLGKFKSESPDTRVINHDTTHEYL